MDNCKNSSNRISTETSNVISWLRFPLVMMVLFVHVHPMDVPNNVGMQHLDGTSWSNILYTCWSIGSNILSNVSVPTFFLISAYLFFQGMNEWSWSLYGEKLKRRAKTLLLPYLIFNLFIELTYRLGWSVNFASNPSPTPLVSSLWDSTTYCLGMTNWLGFDIQLEIPNDVPLWFMRDLMCMMIAAPLLHYVLRRFSFFPLVLAGVLFSIGLGCQAPGWSTQAIFFFGLGAWLAMRGKDLSEWGIKALRLTLPVGLVMWGVALATDGLDWSHLFNQLFFVFGAPAMVGIAALLLNKGWGRVHPLLANSSFWVYAVHMVAIGTFSILNISCMLPRSIFNMDSCLGCFCNFITAAFLCEGLSILLYIVLHRMCPKVLGLLTGGR